MDHAHSTAIIPDNALPQVWATTEVQVHRKSIAGSLAGSPRSRVQVRMTHSSETCQVQCKETGKDLQTMTVGTSFGVAGHPWIP